jgi:hypothetical protein
VYFLAYRVKGQQLHAYFCYQHWASRQSTSCTYIPSSFATCSHSSHSICLSRALLLCLSYLHGAFGTGLPNKGVGVRWDIYSFHGLFCLLTHINTQWALLHYSSCSLSFLSNKSYFLYTGIGSSFSWLPSQFPGLWRQGPSTPTFSTLTPACNIYTYIHIYIYTYIHIHIHIYIYIYIYIYVKRFIIRNWLMGL